MFDTIESKYPGFEGKFQTKSLDCRMDYYILSFEGNLLCKKRFYIPLTPAQSAEHHKNNPNTPMPPYIVQEEIFPYPYHGIIRFFNIQFTPTAEVKQWVEHEAFFSAGKLLHIRTIEENQRGPVYL